MALSDLKSYTKAEFDRLDITAFPKAPRRSNGGTPDNRANTQLRGWIGSDVLAFIVTNNAGAESALTIDTGKAKTLDINVTRSCLLYTSPSPRDS